jgi:hypothetical protein
MRLLTTWLMVDSTKPVLMGVVARIEQQVK